jgi:preprotein translocase subunit YajC
MGEEGLGIWGMVIFLVAIFAIMYFLMIRPRQKQQRMRELRVGEKVIIAGGIYGQIERLGEDTVILKLESGATMKVARSSILGKEEVGESSSRGVF